MRKKERSISVPFCIEVDDFFVLHTMKIDLLLGSRGFIKV